MKVLPKGWLVLPACQAAVTQAHLEGAHLKQIARAFGYKSPDAITRAVDTLCHAVLGHSVCLRHKPDDLSTEGWKAVYAPDHHSRLLVMEMAVSAYRGQEGKQS